MDALQWAYAVEYAKRQKNPRRRGRSSRKAGWALFLWFLGIGL